MEEWKNGRMEEWKNGRMEGWKNGRYISTKCCNFNNHGCNPWKQINKSTNKI
jgi:hypothetical protein